MELLKQEKEQLFRTEDNLTKDQQLQFLQQTMQGMQQVPAQACCCGCFVLLFRKGMCVVFGREMRAICRAGEEEEMTTEKLSC